MLVVVVAADVLVVDAVDVEVVVSATWLGGLLLHAPTNTAAASSSRLIAVSGG